MTDEMMRRRSNEVKALVAPDLTGLDLDPLFLVWLVSRSTEDLLDGVLTSTGLTADELALYSVLAAGPMTPSELARWMAAPATTVSSYVKRLTRRGHVERVPHPTDRRSYRIALTDAGRRVHADAVELVVPVRQRVAAALGQQDDPVRQALTALRVVVDGLRAGA